MEEPPLQSCLKMLRNLSKGTFGHELEALVAKGLRVEEARKGFLLCSFVVHNGVSDENGNWHVGAISMLIDIVGSVPARSVTQHFNVSVDFSISFYSTANVQEEVEIEAKVVKKRERLTSVVVEVRKKETGEMIALGKQWMASTNISPSRHHHQASKL